MTIKKFREIAAESKFNEWLKGLSIKLEYFGTNEPIVKTGITDIYRFYVNNSKEWNKFPDDIPGRLLRVKEHFNKCVKNLINFIENVDRKNESNRDRAWSDLRSILSMHQHGNDYKILLPELPHIPFLLKVHEDFPSSFDGSYDYLILGIIDRNKLTANNAKSEYLRGIILAYEFELQDHTELLQRRNHERKSLGLLRSNLDKYLSDVETETQDYLSRTKENFDKHVEKLDQLEKTKEELFDQWFGTTMNNFKTFDEDSHKKIEELEKIYQEKLRLEAPAQYWENRAKDLRKNGNWWTVAFTATLLLIVVSLFSLLWLTPDGMFADLFSGEPHAVKWAVIYVTFLSFFAYGLRIFSKLAMSSYHLSRDAEERQQLTYVYLALKKDDAKVEEKDRLLILQSLFSRSETGLLKEDSNPTMPGNFLNKLNS